MKKLGYLLLFFLVFFILTFFVWRQKAPKYDGQNLHAVVPAVNEVELIVVGDMGTGGEDQLRMAQAMNTYCETHPLAAIVFLGDNFYPHGVKTVEDEQWESKFRKPYSLPCLKKTPFYALLGNHDYKGNPKAQIEYKGEEPTWNMLHRFYDVRFGNILTLTMIDTNILDICGFSNFCTLDFVRKSLNEATTPFKIVAGHHPIASSSGKYARTFQGNFLEKYLCERAHFYIAGHSHHLEHLASAGCKTQMDLFVVGGGGADLYALREWQNETKFAESTFGFMALKANAETIQFTLYDDRLKKLYEFQRKKSEEDKAAEKPPAN